MTIIVTFTDGSTATFTSCSGYTNDGKVVHFSGQKNGDTKVKTWDLNFAMVKSVSQET